MICKHMQMDARRPPFGVEAWAQFYTKERGGWVEWGPPVVLTPDTTVVSAPPADRAVEVLTRIRWNDLVVLEVGPILCLGQEFRIRFV